jgi:hypothetical protein
MAGTFTSRLRLYKPAADGSDNVNVVTDLNNNLDRLDAIVSFVPVTTGTYPASGYHGQAFYETDTGKAFVNVSTSASTITKRQVLLEGASFGASATYTGGVFSGGEFRSTQATGAGRAFVARIGAESWDRWRVDQDGAMAWGGGSAETDVYVYRSGIGELTIGGDGGATLTLDGDLVVGGDVSAANVDVSGDLSLSSGGVYRNRLSSTVTVANTTVETTLALMTLPANDMVAGALYRCQVKGYASVTGAPTIAFRGRVGGTQFITSGSITCSSGVLNKPWSVEFWLACVSTGVSGTARAHGLTTETLSLTGNNGPTSSSVTRSDATTSAITVNTTGVLALEVTVQWGTASASNTLTSLIGSIERVA